jgi:hypothetical protein
MHKAGVYGNDRKFSGKVEMRNLSCPCIDVTDVMLSNEHNLVFDSLRAYNHVDYKM